MFLFMKIILFEEPNFISIVIMNTVINVLKENYLILIELIKLLIIALNRNHLVLETFFFYKLNFSCYLIEDED